MAKGTRESRIKEEYTKLHKLYEGLPKNKLTLVEGLIENAAFMTVTLEDLQEKIKEEGAVIVAKNGNGFDITQEHPAQKSYNAMINRYTSVIKQLDALLPSEKIKGKLESLLDE